MTEPMIAFDCGACLGKGSVERPARNGVGTFTDWCEACEGRGKIRITLDELAERIAAKMTATPIRPFYATVGEAQELNAKERA